MANSDRAYGLRPIGHLLGVPLNGAGKWYMANCTEQIMKGDLVISDGTADTGGYPGITIAATDSGTYRGVAWGFHGADTKPGAGVSATDHELKYKAATATKIYVFVYDDPYVLYAAQEDGTMGVAGCGLNAEMTSATNGAANTKTGLSGMEIDSSSVSSTCADVRVLYPLRVENNNPATDNAEWVVTIAHHEVNSSTQILAGAK